MNVNKLADKLKLVRCLAGDGQVLNDAETMLRQQQVQIYQLLETQDYLYKRHDKQQAEIEQWGVEFDKLTDDFMKQQTEIGTLEAEIFVKDAIKKSYKEALEQIATGSIAGEFNNYKDTVYVMRQIALDALAILRKAQKK